MFCSKWEQEDANISPTERTKNIIDGTMEGLEAFLKFTMETKEDFSSGWLATLDTDLLVSENNRIEYKFYEKPVSSNVTVQQKTAMDENNKMKTLSNELTRRLLNTSESLGDTVGIQVVDSYSQKLMNSGYRKEQIQKIIINGIKCYERKLGECRNGTRKLHRTGQDSSGSRYRKKVTNKTEWYRKKKKPEENDTAPGQGTFKRGKWSIARMGEQKPKDVRTKTVLFVEHTDDEGDAL